MTASPPVLPPDLVASARRWQALDPDTATRAAVDRMIAAGDAPALLRAFDQRLGFGTAGIRGVLGPGPGGLNRLMVRQVAAGVATVLLDQHGDAGSRGVVIGFDGRHGSRDFAQDAARVLGGAGLTVFLFDDVVPTPLLAHAIRHLGCVAGVMVTASHNPPRDNGVKVYWGHGAQITAPLDAQISAAIAAVAAADTPVPAPDLPGLRAEGRVRAVPAGQRSAYVAAVQELRVHHPTAAVPAVYTAMHGVGWSLLVDVLTAAGHSLPDAVASQRDPDPDFPTVSFPNPEEAGALDLAYRLAEQRGARLVIANDPDADRLAVAIPTDSGWRRLTGNEVGLLLAEDLLAHRRVVGSEGQPLVCTTIVSSSLLADIAAAHGSAHAEVLTGFKWLAQAGMHWPGPFVLGFEEALGYSIGGLVRDKDGVSTALVLLDLAGWLAEQGRSIADALDDLARKYGVAESSQHSIKLPGAEGNARIAALMAELRQAPPDAIAGRRVRRIRDVQAGTATDLASGQVAALDLPQSNVLAFDLDAGCRVLARPSGTEPKLKLYFEARLAVAPGEAPAATRTRAQGVLAELQADMLARMGLSGG